MYFSDVFFGCVLVLVLVEVEGVPHIQLSKMKTIQFHLNCSVVSKDVIKVGQFVVAVDFGGFSK